MTEPTRYVPGSHYMLCDRTGFKRRVDKVRREWDQLEVWDKVWEPRQPQDFVRGVRDDQAASPIRARQVDQFTIVGTFVTAFQRRLQSTVQVKTTLGFLVLDQVAVMLDEGDPYYPFIVGLTATSMDLCPVLPGSVGRGIDEGVYFGQENSVLLWRRGDTPDLGPFILDQDCHDVLDVNLLN